MADNLGIVEVDFNYIEGMLDGLRPPPRLKPTEWADTHRYLSSKASSMPGRWSTARTPYLAEIMDCFDNYSPVQEVVFMKGAQIGATEVLYNIMGYFIDIAPGPIMSIMPTESTSKNNVKQRFNPMIDASPTLTKKIAKNKTRDSSNTLSHKDFPGGAIIFAGANSAASLRSLPIRVLLMDEIDGYPSDLDGEGSPVELAKVRTSTFGNKKIAYVSTPTDEDTSMVAEYFADSDQRYYNVPCPHCGVFQPLVFERLVYDKTKKLITEAKYQCEGCDELIEERYKTKMLAAGTWIATNPDYDSKLRRGYHLSSLYSPKGWKSWPEIAQQYETAERKNNDELRRVFVNTVLGQTSKHKSKTPKPQRLFDRAGGYAQGHVPAGAYILTAGVDVQADRLEAEIVGWGPDGRSWTIEYLVLFGKTDQPEVWTQLSKVLYQTWPHADGKPIGLSKMAVDSGFNTQKVYNWCRQHSPALVLAVKGNSNSRQSTMVRSTEAVDRTEGGKKLSGVNLFTLGVDVIKSETYTRLNTELDDDGNPLPGYCEFPDGLPLEYYKMLCSERQIVEKDPKGYPRFIWQKLRARNEAFDCRVYARAAVHILGVDRWSPEEWAQERINLYVPPVPATIAAQIENFDTRDAPVAVVQKPKKSRKQDSIWDR